LRLKKIIPMVRTNIEISAIPKIEISPVENKKRLPFHPFDHHQFLTDGCENCETLNLKNNTELVSQWTTNAYSGYERANSFQNFNSLW